MFSGNRYMKVLLTVAGAVKGDFTFTKVTGQHKRNLLLFCLIGHGYRKISTGVGHLIDVLLVLDFVLIIVIADQIDVFARHPVDHRANETGKQHEHKNY